MQLSQLLLLEHVAHFKGAVHLVQVCAIGFIYSPSGQDGCEEDCTGFGIDEDDEEDGIGDDDSGKLTGSYSGGKHSPHPQKPLHSVSHSGV